MFSFAEIECRWTAGFRIYRDCKDARFFETPLYSLSCLM